MSLPITVSRLVVVVPRMNTAHRANPDLSCHVTGRIRVLNCVQRRSKVANAAHEVRVREASHLLPNRVFLRSNRRMHRAPTMVKIVPDIFPGGFVCLLRCCCGKTSHVMSHLTIGIETGAYLW